MSTTLNGVDIVDKRIDVFLESLVVGHCHFHRNFAFVVGDMNHVADKRFLAFVEVAHEVVQTGFGVVNLGAWHTVLVLVAQVGEREGHAGVKVSKVAEAVAQNAELIYCGLENGGIGVEDNGGAVIFFSTFSNYFHFACGLAKSVFLHIYFAFTAHFGAKVVAKCVHTTYAHTVQTARHFIGAFVELTAGVQHSHYHLKCRLVEFFMLVHRNTTAVVAHGDGVVFANGHSDLVAETCKGFVDRVIYNF